MIHQWALPMHAKLDAIHLRRLTSDVLCGTRSRVPAETSREFRVPRGPMERTWSETAQTPPGVIFDRGTPFDT